MNVIHFRHLPQLPVNNQYADQKKKQGTENRDHHVTHDVFLNRINKHGGSERRTRGLTGVTYHNENSLAENYLKKLMLSYEFNLSNLLTRRDYQACTLPWLC
ncbi:hypothetical protein [Enterobacter quasiroggenkampii]|uniref:Uncharacterized protein n=1 Tax=Enterobacter quasiroggenkampii TaxID=2497436 RepID=A0ABY8E714_9ENTR|nr:hypothetical protein [Enterobacter quasiroggenkampii]WFC84932.1 hypothetical protein OM418_08495 [Enterobacter quasiroggenkampii]